MVSDLSAYMFVVSPKGLAVAPVQLQEFIDNNKHIERWWNYIPLCYVFSSKLDVVELERMFRKFFDSSKTDFFIAKIDVAQTEGWLPPEAWDSFLSDIEE